MDESIPNGEYSNQKELHINEAQNQKQFDILTKLRMQYDHSTRGERGGWRKRAN